MALAFEYGVAQTVAVVCYDGETPTAPTNPVVTVSIDGAAFEAADNSPSVVGPVVFYELSAAEMTAGNTVVKIASDNLEDHYREVYPSGVYTTERGEALDHIPRSIGDTYYVDGTSGNDANTGLYPADAAFATVGQALATAGNGDHVIVSAGVYDEAGLDITQTDLELIGEQGFILGGGGGTVLTVSGAHCCITNVRLEPQTGAQVGVAITGAYTTCTDIRAEGCTVAFDVNSDHNTFTNCRSVTHSATAFDVAGEDNEFLRCHSSGAAQPTRGFYCSDAGADHNEFLFCASVDDGTASFETVGGADNNAFIFCAGDAAITDAGSDTLAAGYSTESVAATEAAIRGADDDTLKTLSDQIDAIDPGGAYVTTRTFVDGDGNAVGDIKITVQSDDGGSASGTVVGKKTTTSSGNVTFNLDNGTYHFLSPSTGVWQASDTTVTVASANTTGDITVTAQTLPTPSSADKYTIIINAADEYGDLVGASAWTVKVTDVRPRRLATANLVQLSEENTVPIDGNGQGSFEISKETTQFTVEITPTLADATTGETVTITAIVDSDAANDSDQIQLADLQFIE